ncbi:hypothetical protein BgAZ_104100 [Babesia gibsoni]|uniref:Sphingomyelin synthase-like domain-containing protein n=1 Tax=Babesia gibsoni TaxID=33632 RepID=A0AAD8PFN1_BABGI|nr:hypothetical protein BgAZ_104100 [Babesia gibsoni]
MNEVIGDYPRVTSREEKQLSIFSLEIPGPSSEEPHLGVNTSNPGYIEKVLSDCKHLVFMMFMRLLLITAIFVVVILLQALCIWNGERIYAIYRTGTYMKPQFEGQYVNYTMSALYDHIQVAFSNWYGINGFSVDYVNGVVGALLSLVILKSVVFSPLMPSLQMLVRYIYIMSQIYFIRGLFVLVTVVPTETCRPIDLDEGFFGQYFQVLKGYLSIEKTCTDVIVSGHAAGTTILACLFVLYNRSWFLNTLAIIMASIIYFTLIISRTHYTIDVMFGIFIAVVLYNTHMNQIEQVGRRVTEDEKQKYSKISNITNYIASVEMVEERVKLFLKLNMIKQAEGANIDYNQRARIEYYCALFGIDDDISAKEVYRGFDVWSIATFKLIRNQLRQKVRRRRVDVIIDNPDSVNVNV